MESGWVLYVDSRNHHFLERNSSEFFPIDQRVVQGSTLSLTLFLVNSNGLLCEIEKYPHFFLVLDIPKTHCPVFVYK